MLPHDTPAFDFAALDYHQLYDNREVLEAVLNQIPDGIIIARAGDGEILLLNRVARQAIGNTLANGSWQLPHYEGSLTYTDGSRVPPEQLPITKAFRGESLEQQEYLFTTPDGQVRYHRINSAPLRSADGSIIAGILVFRDHTEQKRIEDVLQQSELRYKRKLQGEAPPQDIGSLQERFSKAFQASPYPLGITRVQDGRYLDVNDMALRQTGYSREEFLGRTGLEIGLLENDAAYHRLQEAFQQQGNLHDFEVEFITKAGEKRIGLFSANLIEFDGESFVLSSTIDITEQRRAERIQAAAYEISQAANSVAELSVLFQSAQHILERLLSSDTFFVALTELDAKPLRVAYQADKAKLSAEDESLRLRISEYVLRTQQPLYATPATIQEIARRQDIPTPSRLPEYWYSVPLQTQTQTLGVIAIQAFSDNAKLSEEEKTLLIFAAHQVAMAIERKRVEARIHASREWFRKAFDLSPHSMCINHLKTAVFVDVNHRFIEVFGFTREELLGRTIAEMNVWRSASQREELVHILKKERKLSNREIVFYTKAGEQRYALISADIIEVNGDRFVLTSINDITARKKEEQEFAASNERFSKAFHTSPMQMSITRMADGRYIDVNKSFLQASGYSREELIGRTSLEVNIWADSAERSEVIALLAREGSFSNREIRFRMKSGEIRIFLVSAETLMLGEERCLLLVANDITERKQHEEKVRLSEERFSKAFNLSPLPMHIISLEDGCYMDVNDAFTEVTGYRRDETIHKTGTQLNLWTSPEERVRMREALLATGSLRNMEGSFRRRDGEIRVALFSSEIMTIGGKSCVLTAINDITERKHGEEALRASEERFAKTFHANPLPMALLSFPEGRILDVNESALAYGYSREDLLGRTLDELAVWGDEETRQNFFRIFSNQQSISGADVKFRTKSGGMILGLLSAERLHIEGGACVLISLMDITERKKQEEFILAAERELQTTFDSLPDSVILVDKDDRLLRANQTFYERNQFKPEEAIGKDVRRLLHQQNDYIGAEACPICELRVRHQRGSIELPAGVLSDYPMLASIEPIFDDNHELIATVQVMRNLSALYSAREEAEQERSSLRATLENMADGLMLFDDKGNVIRANSAAGRILGIPLEQMQDLASNVLFGRLSSKDGNLLPPQQQPIQLCMREQRQIGEHIYSYERPDEGTGDRDEKKLFVSITASPFFNEVGKLSGVVAVLRDSTRQQREQERLQQADKLRALGQLASGVAHNFNNALAAVIGYSQLALRKTKEQEVQKYLRVIEQSSRDAARMVERIQNFSRSRTQEDEFTKARIVDIVRDAIDITRPRWRHDAEATGIRYNVTLHWQADEELFIICEPSELREVFVNLILNALDAMPAGGDLMITAETFDSSIRIRFQDTGIGMSEEVKSRIFDPFFTTKGVLGLGLGLSESYRIVERHGGSFDVESKPQGGAIFTVHLPLQNIEIRHARHSSAEMPGYQLRVLVVDDEELVRYALVSVLEELGHQAVQAGSGEEALELLSQKPFDLVFTDLAMPNMDGVAAAKEMKQHNPNVALILMSGYSQEKLEERAQGSDFIDGMMLKPFKIDEIQKVLKEVIKKRRDRSG